MLGLFRKRCSSQMVSECVRTHGLISPKSVISHFFGTRDRFHGRQFFHGHRAGKGGNVSLGKQWALLTSCCAAQFWTGWGRLVHGLGVGDPCPKWLSRSLRVFVYLSFPWTVSLPSWLLSLADVCSWPNCDEGLSPLGPRAPYWLQTPELRSRFPPPLPVSAAGSSPGRGDPPLLLWLSLSSTSLHGSWASCHMATPHHNGHMDEIGPRWIYEATCGAVSFRGPYGKREQSTSLPWLVCQPHYQTHFSLCLWTKTGHLSPLTTFLSLVSSLWDLR